MGIVRFLELAAKRRGAENRRYPDPYRTILFFSAVGWTVLASLIENRLASDIHGRPLPSARRVPCLRCFVTRWR